DRVPFLRHRPGHEGFDRGLLLGDAFSFRLQFLHHRLRLGPLPLQRLRQLFESLLALLQALRPRLEFGLRGLNRCSRASSSSFALATFCISFWWASINACCSAIRSLSSRP